MRNNKALLFPVFIKIVSVVNPLFRLKVCIASCMSNGDKFVKTYTFEIASSQLTELKAFVRMKNVTFSTPLATKVSSEN